MQIGEFTLANSDKAERAINGSVMSEGQMKGGVGVDAEEHEILAEYDRLGGLVLMDGNKVKTGCFWDFKNKCAVKKPKAILVFRIDGEDVEVDADQPLPLEVRAKKAADAKKKEKKEAAARARAEAKAATKNKGGKTKKVKDEEEEEEESDEESEDGDLA